MTAFDTPEEKPFENMVIEGENIGDEHFLLFPLCTLPWYRIMVAMTTKVKNSLKVFSSQTTNWIALFFCRNVS